MPKDTMSDLTNHLYAQIERLGDESLDDVKLDAEIRRSKALTDVAGRIIDTQRLQVLAWRTLADYGTAPDPAMLLKGAVPRRITRGGT